MLFNFQANNPDQNNKPRTFMLQAEYSKESTVLKRENFSVSLRKKKKEVLL